MDEVPLCYQQVSGTGRQLGLESVGAGVVLRPR